VIWGMLTVLGIFLFFRFLAQTEHEKTELGSNTTQSDEESVGNFNKK
jgi:hypothetical protein